MLRTALLVVALGLMATSQAHAQQEVPRFQVGVQAGGSAYFQLMIRLRLFGPLLLEGGALGIGGGGVIGNGSLGLALELNLGRVSPFLAGGGGGGAACGEQFEEEPAPASPSTPDMPAGSQSEMTEERITLSCGGAAFQYGRLGVVIDLTEDKVHRLMIDGGYWYGIVGSEGERNRMFLSPMAGVGYYWTL